MLSKMNLKKHLTRRHNVAKPAADAMLRDMCKSRPGFTEVRRVVQQAPHCRRGQASYKLGNMELGYSQAGQHRTRLFSSWAT